MPSEEGYSIGELATLAGVTPRTIRYYVSIGLLPSPGQQGPQSRYGDGHLARLRLIRKLQRAHLPLSEIATRLGGMDDAAIEQVEAAEEAVAAPGSALDYIRQVRDGRRVRDGRQVRDGSALDESGLLMAMPFAVAPAQESVESQRTQWERVTLSQNVELHIRRPLSRLEQKRIERLIRIGREILEEGDQP